MNYESSFGDFYFSTRKDLIDVQYVHQWLSEESYWAKGIPIETVRTSIMNSTAVGVYHDGKQIGFARLIHDSATFGYLADVFIDEQFRGQNLSKKLIEFILSFEEVKSFRRMILATRDAHTLYQRFGFTALAIPDRWMEKHQSDVYNKKLSKP
jgi:GNAT superfamily N-acetyltransferase